MAANRDVIEYPLTMLWRYNALAFTRKLTGYETTIVITLTILKLNSWDFLMTSTIFLLKLLMSCNNSLRGTVLSLWRSKDQKNCFVIDDICKLISIKSLIFRFRHRNWMLSLNCAMLKSKLNLSYVCIYSIYLRGNIFLAISDKFGAQWETEINSHVHEICVYVCIFQFPIDHKIHHKWLKKCHPKDKFNKSTCRISLNYFSMAPFIDNIKFPLWNVNINNLMFMHFHN